MKRTPLYDTHVRLGAKMVPFGGWDMPVFYPTGIIAEHNSVRNSAGIFDIGHMGIASISGNKAEVFLQKVLTNDISKLASGSAHYSLILNNDGGIIDDIFVYRVPDGKIVLVLNASNTEKDVAWLKKNSAAGVEIEDLKDNMTLLALQGPKSQSLLQNICSSDLNKVGHHQIISSIKIDGNISMLSRTGYTGEDGFELFINASAAEKIWNKLIKLGAAPCGLGARDTLRLEAGMPLYGHEYNEDITPLETPFMFAVKMDKNDFIGKARLVALKQRGIENKLVGIKMKEAGIPRQDYKIFKDGAAIGHITSGTMSPTLNLPVGMGYVKAESSAAGTPIDVEIRGRSVPAEIVKLPFYKRPAV